MNTSLARTLMIAALIAPVAGYAASTKSVEKVIKENVSDAVITTGIKNENANDNAVSALNIKVDADGKSVVTPSGNAGSKAEADKAVNTMAQNASPAASRGDEVLPTVNPGASNRENAVNAITPPAQAEKKFEWDGANFAALPSGFNLISTVQSLTPSQFNIQVSPTPPAAGVIPTDNFVSLWAWDAAEKVWYFYSPILEASGGLPAVKAYTDSHSLRHFQDYDRLLDLGTGFWVNRI